MPQLDKASFYLQSHSVAFFFILFYMVVLRIFIPNMLTTLKLREFLAIKYFMSGIIISAHIDFFHLYQREIALTLLSIIISMITIYLKGLKLCLNNRFFKIQEEFYVEPYVYTLKKIVFLKRV